MDGSEKSAFFLYGKLLKSSAQKFLLISGGSFVTGVVGDEI